MPTPIKKNFCTIYHRSDFEKATFNAVKELNQTKRELEELKKEMAEMRKMVTPETEPKEEPKKSTRKKSSSN